MEQIKRISHLGKSNSKLTMYILRDWLGNVDCEGSCEDKGDTRMVVFEG